MSYFAINAVHIHLILNHFPIVLSIFCPFLLLYGIYRKNVEIIQVSLFVFIVIAVITIPVFLAWKAALGMVSAIPGVNTHALVIHERVAKITFGLILTLWSISAIALCLGKYSNTSHSYRYFQYIILVLSVIVFWAVCITGYYWWSIRHTEIFSTVSMVNLISA